MAEDPHSARDMLERLEDLADHQDQVRIGDAADEFGHRSFGPFLFVLPLVEISPVGGIPGLPTFLAFVIALIGGQLIFRDDHIWLPNFIEKRSISADKLKKVTDKLEGVAAWLDRWFHDRLRNLAHGVWVKIAGALIVLLCLTVPPLEFIPFASTAPMVAIAAFGLAMLVRDGLLMLIAVVLTAAAIGFTGYILFTQGLSLPFG